MYQIGGPERQITLQQRRAGIEKALCRIADRKIQKLAGGKVAGLFEQAGLAVNLSRNTQNQLCQCRMKLFPYNQSRCGRKERRVARWAVCAQVNCSFRQSQGSKKVMLQCIGWSAIDVQ